MLTLKQLRAKVVDLDQLAQSMSIEVAFASATEAPWTEQEQRAYVAGIAACMMGIDDARCALEEMLARLEAAKPAATVRTADKVCHVAL
jgi:hypothetical protein